MTELLGYEFFRNALAACVFGGGGLAVIGVFLTLMQAPFLGVCMSHAAFLGAVLGMLLGCPVMVCAMIACALAGIAIGPLAEKSDTSSNVALSIIFSATMGLSLILLSLVPGPKTEALNLIWGSLLTVTRPQVLVLAAVCLALAVFLWLFFKEIAAVLFNREIAAATGIPESLIYYGIILMGGMAVSAALDMVGGLLVFALLINPANAAYQLTCRIKTMLWLSAFFGILSCLGGLAASYAFNVPAGGCAALISCGVFLAAMAYKRTKRTTG